MVPTFRCPPKRVKFSAVGAYHHDRTDQCFSGGYRYASDLENLAEQRIRPGPPGVGENLLLESP